MLLWLYSFKLEYLIGTFIKYIFRPSNEINL